MTTRPLAPPADPTAERRRTWSLGELLCRGKHGDAAGVDDRNEDAHIIVGPLVAVIDGVTDKSGAVFDLEGHPVSSGRFAAQVVAAALGEVAGWGVADRTPARAVAHLTGSLRDAVADQHPQLLTSSTRPGCSVLVLDCDREQMWRVGDCIWAAAQGVDEAHAVLIRNALEKIVDTVAADIRAAVVTSLPVGRVGTGADPGREAISDLLFHQGLLSNRDCAAGYGVIDGTDVPARFIETWDVHRYDRLVLASDGYGRPEPALVAGLRADLRGESGLAVAEQLLAAAVVSDPLCVAELRGTKAVPPGAESYDDRTWIGLARDPASASPSARA